MSLVEQERVRDNGERWSWVKREGEGEEGNQRRAVVSEERKGGELRREERTWVRGTERGGRQGLIV